MFRRQRQRRLFALCALLGLLFQQLAMAAYLCPQDAEALGLGALVAQTAAPSCHRGVELDQARCSEHCHPTLSSANHVTALSVPALAPLMTAPWPALVAPDSRGAIELERRLDACAHPPPLTVQYCTFQI